MSEKFSLKWHDYQFNWTQSLSELRNDKESADITLISEDKVKFSAHKIVLSSCSKTFKYILKGHFHSNPLLYLSGVSSVNLGFILDYIYHGEVTLSQEQLDNFLESSQNLEIEGLIGDNKEQEHQDLLGYEDQKNSFKKENIEQVHENNVLMKVYNDYKPRKYNRVAPSNNQVAKFDAGSMTAEEIEMKKEALYLKVDGNWRCLACDYTTTTRRTPHIRMHVEIHMEGLCYTCSVCNKVYRTKNSLDKHKYTSKHI